MKSNPPSTNRLAFLPWLILVFALLPANIRQWKQINDKDLLAEVAGQKLYRSQLSADAAADILKAESAAYQATDRSVRVWAEKVVFDRAAVKNGLSVDRWLDQEVTSKAKVTDDEVYARYVKSPYTDQRPYPAVLDDIRRALLAEKAAALQREMADRLFRQEGFRLTIRPPQGYVPPRTGRYYPEYLAPDPESFKNGRVAGPPSKGPVDAPIVVEVYSDFMCPFSRKFSQTLKALEGRYPGKLRLVFRHFPLPMHTGADFLAEASVCAQEQGKFWEMHDALMAWDGPVDTTKLSQTAQSIGVDPMAFGGCLAQRRYKNFVQQEIASAKPRGVGSTPTFFLNGRMAVGAQSEDQLKPVIDWFLSPKGEYPGKALNPRPQAPGQPRPPAQAPVPDGRPVEFPKEFLSRGPARGPAGAAVTMVEFIDYNCPFCKKGAEIVDPLLKDAKTPVRFLSKQNPLSMHPNAQNAAVAALCADRQGRYWEFRDHVFGEFWGKQTPDDLKQIASHMGLDRKKFDACLDGQETLADVKKDLEAGAAAGAQGTPTYFINGRRVVGANPDALKQALAEAAAPPKK